MNKKRHSIQILKLEDADKEIVNAVKYAIKKDPLYFSFNPYYVKNSDTVKYKKKNNGAIKSVKIKLGDKFYKPKKNEWIFDKDINEIFFVGENLNGSYKIS